MANNFFQDKEGNFSSKRLAGFISLGMAMAVAVVGIVTQQAGEVTGLVGIFSGLTTACFGLSGLTERRM